MKAKLKDIDEKARRDMVLKGIHSIASRTMPEGSHVLLYGSRARGDYHEGSDWDLLLLINKSSVEQEDYRNIVFPITSYGWDVNEMIVPIIKTQKEWDDDTCTIFHKNVEQEAIFIL